MRLARPSRLASPSQGSKGTAAAAGLLLLGMSFASAAEARTSCSYTGPPANVLIVTATGDELGEIRRDGQEIVVGEFLEPPTRCSGGDPTVLNTDTISVRIRDILGSVDLRLEGGPFAPGATPEDVGEAEIEVEFTGPAPFGEVVGTSRADEWHWTPGGAHAGLNLNPDSAGDQDVDLTLTGGELTFLVADGAGGADSIVPAPDAGAIDDGVFSVGGRGDDLLVAPGNSPSILEGGLGDDLLTGSRRPDSLDGGAGNDGIAGKGGSDRIIGGRGRDLLSGERGNDRIDARDSRRDIVRCGPGRDRARADRPDRLSRCERVSRR